MKGVGSRGEPVPYARVSATHILLNCQETQRLRENFLDKKWLQMNKAVAFMKLVSSKTTNLRQLGIILYKIRCKLEHHTKQPRVGGGGSIILVVIISCLVQVD